MPEVNEIPEAYEWEHVHKSGAVEMTERFKVPGGWLYRTIVCTQVTGMLMHMTYVPEPEVRYVAAQVAEPVRVLNPITSQVT
jgi:hypothetical protein